MNQKINLFNYISVYERNSNFGFSEKENPEYLKTSSGKILPYKLFSSNSNSRTREVWEANNNNYAPYAAIERRFTENKTLSFSSGERILSVNDIAWLFRSLEDEAVEHLFLLYRFQDDSYLVQHLSSGSFQSTLADLALFAGNVLKMKPKSISFIHNHPSGKLVAGGSDIIIYKKIKNFFQNTNIVVEDAIIINLRSGKYLIFNDEISTELNLKNQTQEQKNIKIFSFSKQVFLGNFQPHKINGASQVAAYLSSQKFGLSDKTEILIINNANEIIGKFILPQFKQFEKIVELITIYGGTAAILYGNNITQNLIKNINSKLKILGFKILDGFRFESTNHYYSVIENEFINVEPLDDIVINNTKQKEDELQLSVREDPEHYILKRSTEISIEVGVYSDKENLSKPFTQLTFLSIDELKVYLDIVAQNYELDPTLIVRIGKGYQSHLLARGTPVALYDFLLEIKDHYYKVNVSDNLTYNHITMDLINLIPEKRRGEAFLIKVSKEEAEYLIAKDILPDVMCKEYGDDDDWIGMTKDDFEEGTTKFDMDYQTFELDVAGLSETNIKALLHEIEIFREIPEFAVNITETLSTMVKVKAETEQKAKKIVDEMYKNQEIVLDAENFLGVEIEIQEELMEKLQSKEIIGGKIEDIAKQFLMNPDYELNFDNQYKNLIHQYIKSSSFINSLNSELLLKLSDRWVNEMSNPTGLSKGMSYNQMSEQQSYFFNLYKLNLKNVNNQNMKDSQQKEKPEILLNRFVIDAISELTDVNFVQKSFDLLSNEQVEWLEENGKEKAVELFSFIREEKVNPQITEMIGDRFEKVFKQVLPNYKINDSIEISNFENINNQNSNIMEKKKQEFVVGRLATVQTEKGLFKGIIQSVDNDNIVIKNLEGNITTAKKEEVYQFFPGQKYDKREFEAIFSKIGADKFTELKYEDLIRLERGEITKNTYTVQGRGENEGKEFIIKYEPKYNKEKGMLEVVPRFKSHNFDLEQTPVYGMVLDNNQIAQLKEGNSVILSRINKEEKNYFAKVHYDSDLNNVFLDKFVTKEDYDKSLVTNSNLYLNFENRAEYEQWIMNEVGIFDNASKINKHQLNKLLISDDKNIAGILFNAGVNEESIHKLSNFDDNMDLKNDDLNSLKSEILISINADYNNVESFKNDFKNLFEQSDSISQKM